MNAKEPTRRWYRFSLRTMFVLVTLTCISVSGWVWAKNWGDARRQKFSMELDKHMLQLSKWPTCSYAQTIVPPWPINAPEVNIQRHYKFREEHFAYHNALVNKYLGAGDFPWLPVEPDPPEPVDPFQTEDDWLTVKAE